MTEQLGEYLVEFRELRCSEISLAVDSYGEMIKELSEKYDNPILPTDKTLRYVDFVLDQYYQNGGKCYVACVDNIIIGYSLFFENVAYDTKYRIVYGLGLYVEQEYRKEGIGMKLIEFTFDNLREAGVKKFLANFHIENPSYVKVVEKFGMEDNKGSKWKNLS